MNLDDRLRRLARRGGSGDWDDVLERAGFRRHARLRLATALVLVAAVVVPTAVAFRNRIVDFAGADEAPRSIERNFGSLNEGLIGSWMPDVVEDRARRVLTVAAPRGERRVLWVAPRRDGGFCWIVEHVSRNGRGEAFTSGCGRREGGRMHAGAALHLPGRSTGSIDIQGRVRDRSITRIELHHEDGAIAELPIVWVSDPIGIGFFLHAVPADRLVDDRPTEVIALDRDGEVVKREPLRLGR